jgi:tetratricopeptide (TPR) repeat protein
MLVFAAAAVAGVARAVCGATVAERGVIAAAVGVSAYFLVHGSFDWLEAYPVLAGPALAALFLALRIRPEADPRTSRWVSAMPRPAVAVAGAAVALMAAWSLLVPWLAIRFQQRAADTWRADPAGAYADLDRAASIDPLAVGPLLTEGIIAVERSDLDRARRSFREALGREDHWVAHYELAVLAATAGNKRAAMRQLQMAARLNPQDRVIPAARKDFESGARIDPRELTGRLFESPLFIARRLS